MNRSTPEHARKAAACGTLTVPTGSAAIRVLDQRGEITIRYIVPGAAAPRIDECAMKNSHQ